MEFKIYNRSGELKLTVSTSSSTTWNQELMKEYSVSASFTHPSYVMLDVEDYVLLEGVKFSIKKEYKPRQKDTQTYSYSVKFYAPIHDAEQVKYLHLTDGAYNPQFSLDGGPREHLQKWVENMNRIYGREVWRIGDVVVADNRTIEYNNVTCWDAATMIAEAFGTEWWTDGFTFNLSRCEHGEPVELGYMRGLTSLAQSENSDSVKFFTRLIPLGSTKNIDPSRYGFSRLQLPDRSQYMDRNTNYGLYEHVEEDAFAGIFPHYTGTVTAVRSEEKAGDDGNKFTVYYFKDSGMQFDPNGNEIVGLVKHVSFQTGDLAGRDFEANYDSKTGEWEIINTYPDDKTQIPGGSLIPAVGNEYIPWNFRMPVEYETQAELDYKAAVDDYLARYSEDVSKYGGDTDYIYIDRNRIPLLPGQRVRLLSDKYFSASGGTRDTRMTKVVRKLDNLSIATIECTNQVGKGWKSRVDSSLTDLKYILDKQREQLSLDILKSWDGRPATDYTVMSALRVLKEIAQKALSKTGNDRTEYSLEVGGSLTVDDILHAAKAVKFGEFLTGISGGYIDKNGNLEMEEGIFRKRVFVPEIAYNRVTYFKGRMCASPGGGCTVKEWTDNGDGSYTITPDLTDADGLSQFVDDILTTYFVTKNAEGKLQGFEEMKFRVTSADYTAKTFVMTPKPGTDWKPGDAMVLAQTGNFTDEDRQTYIFIDTVGGNNCITFFDHANTWDVEPAQEMSWIGKKKGRTVHGIPADNYSAVFRHVIMSGKIFQVDDITGEAFRVPLFKGTWKKGEKYAYYDEVTHNGSSWICVNEKGTSTEPADGNADWLKYAAKGESGKGIKSTDVEYAISVSNVIAPVDGWQTTSPEWEAGKYIWSRTKIVYSDGEVKYTQAACISGGQGADGKGIKSITEEYYLSSSSATTTGGEWQTDSPAWKNGWYIWTRTRIVFTDGTSTTTNAICVTGSKGADGTSITNCGEWETGKHIPYMGITKMAGRVFLCVAPDGTDNPPMWTQTTNEGRRILQTQNGGKSYGYTITGDLNTAEYELLVENGQDGRDGRDYEWIFKHTTENIAPATPATSQVDDYVPSGWHDDPIGVSESLPYEWACCRTKKDGVWSAFSPAAIWAKWGFDGESAIVADFDNEMESIALTYEGKTVSQSVLNTTVGMWYGTKKLQLKSISCVTPAGVTESYNVNTGVIAFTVASGISMPARSEVRITVTATVQDTDISRELVFTIAGVRAGNPGSDAILYRLVPSVSSVSKRKDGTYSVASVSCTRTKSVGGSTAVTTDGVLKYSKDDGSEIEIQNGTSISPKNFTKQLQFVFYVGGQVVDRETIPMVVDGNDGNPGKPGGDGESVKAGGEWRTANTPYKKLTICTMGSRSWLSKVDTSNPPLWTQTTHDGRRITQTQNGGKSYGYIITEEVNTDEWEQLTSDGGMVYLISTCSNIRVSNAGSLVPSAFRVYAKRTLGSATLTYPDGYLAARGYSNGIWSSIAGPSRASEITVNASAGYSTFSVRCYQSQADASAWNDSFIAEMSVGVSYDGSSGRDASEPRPRGFFAKGNTYVWNEDYHDIVLATFNNRTIPFRVRAYGTSVTVAPTSIDGDANWEAAQQFMFVAMDMALARKIRADEILVDDLVVQNVLARDKTGKAMCQIDGENGGIGFLAGGNIRWDTNGNVFQDASIFRKLKLLESKSDSYEYYLDFNTGLNFEISRIYSLPTQEETIYLPNAADYEGGECMLYNGGIYTRLTAPASIKVAGGGSFIIDGEYYSKIVVPSLSLAQFKAVATYSDGVKDGVKWVLISGKAESRT
ncbi:hypothetical protein [Bacteroides sp.]|jgi:hypothetical protein|uniref:hypothetical protein n=1 Tax=Bacteroides sp. TaxID=29523 RepID=UPI00205D7199|nr:hypothetical protein [Bacteroides sp.]MDR3953177.1 hypothetical protein [Bacteroides sp.]DAL80411.1 MAG TPA: tail protein [Caudoviricetes sp.]